MLLLQRCKRVFQSLIPFAVEELCEAANSLLAPVRHGVVRLTAPFNLFSTLDYDSKENTTKEVSKFFERIEREHFSAEPLAPRQDRSSASRSSSAATTAYLGHNP